MITGSVSSSESELMVITLIAGLGVSHMTIVGLEASRSEEVFTGL